MSRDALIVGISTYEVLNSLTTPAEDAEAVAQWLAQYGDFHVTRLPGVVDNPTKALRVGRKTKVMQRQLKEALVQLFKPTGKHFPDTALFYFSGHGTRDNLGVSQGFLATSETNPNLELWGIPLKWLRELLQSSPIKQQIIWLDCCYSGELLNFDEANPLDQGEARDRCFIAASREFEVAYEGIARPHSVLTEALLQALDPTHHPEGVITNLTLVDLLNHALQKTIQRPLHINVGSPILLTHRLRRDSVVPTRTASDICPYKGLLHFECNETDPLYFFGREQLTDTLLSKVREHHFVAVLGVSGSGKSSLVQAGLLYQLQQGQKSSGSERWPQLIFRPGEHPLQSLALAFVEPHLSTVERARQAQEAEELIDRGAKGFQHLVRAKAGQERLVLVIDQFEEVFTLCQQEAERQDFFACLLEGLPLISKQLCLVITMRADFFGKCAEQRYAGLSQLIQDHLLTVQPIEDHEALRRVIECPAQLVHLDLEPELVETLIKDLTASPGQLPLLEYTLWALWQGRQDNRLSLAHYVHLGGIHGALQQRADEVYSSLDEKEKATAKAIFLELTQLGEGTEDTRRQVMKQELITPYQSATLVEQTLQKLTAARLVVMDALQSRSGQREQDVVVVDVAHETLIRHWSVLRNWIQENRDFKTWQEKLRRAEREWQEKQQDEELLLRGSKLLEAQEQEKIYRERLTAREAAFIAASGALREREREEKRRIQQEIEAARQRELEQAKQLAEEQAKLVKEQDIRAREQELASQERLEAQQREIAQANKLAEEQAKLVKEQEIRAREQELASQERLEARQREIAEAQQRAQANKLAEEQARHIEAQQQAAKRLRRMLVLAIGGWIGTMIAAGGAVFFGFYAEQQKNIATKQKEIALQAINTVTYNVVDRLKNVPQTTYVSVELLKANMKLLDDLSALDPTSWEAQREKSSNLSKVGDSWLILGDVSKVFAVYQQAFEIRKRLAQADPSNTQAQRDVSISYNNLGDVQLLLGDTQAALSAYQQALEISKHLAQADPSNTQAQRDVSISYEKLGDVQLRLGDIQAALSAYQQALEISKRLAQADPTNTQAQRDVSISYNKLGDVQLQLGETQAALSAYQQGFEISKRLAQADPSNAQARRDVSVSYTKLGDVQRQRCDTQAALSAYQQALEISKHLAKADPKNAQAQRDVSVSYNNIGLTLYKQGQYKEAATTFTQGLQYSPEYLNLLGNDAELALVQNDLPRFQERLAKLLPRVEEYKELTVILPFLSWLADPKKDWKEVWTAIEQHPNLEVMWDFSDLEPVIQRQGSFPFFSWSDVLKPEEGELTAMEPNLTLNWDCSLLEPMKQINRQAVARDFIRFFKKEIDGVELRDRLEGGAVRWGVGMFLGWCGGEND